MSRTRDVEVLNTAGMSDNAIMETLDLRDYRKVPVSYQDPTTGEWREMPDSAIILHPDDNRPVSKVVSADYHVHQASQLLSMVRDYGRESGLELTQIGTSRGSLLAKYRLPRETEQAIIKPGDTVSSGVTLSTGFDGSTSMRIASWIERLICSNGARVTNDAAAFSISHSAKLTGDVLARAGKAVEQVLASTGAHTSWVRRLSNVAVSPAEAKAFLRILAYPGTLIRSEAQLKGRAELDFDALRPAWEALVSELSKAIVWGSDMDQPFAPNTTYRAMLDSYQSAPGAEPNTLAGVWHGVTHHWSNGAGGTRASRQWSVLQDVAAQRNALAASILDSYASAVGA